LVLILLKPKFQPDVDLAVNVHPAAELIDPDAFDASEQRFAASVEEKPTQARFVVDQEDRAKTLDATGTPVPWLQGDHLNSDSTQRNSLDEAGDTKANAPAGSPQTELSAPQDSNAWRNEITSRVNRYRARRRPRTPHYPSLQLKFDPPESPWTTQSGSSRLAVAMQEPVPRETQSLQQEMNTTPAPWEGTEAGAKILEFPRSATTPPRFLDELADPVMDRPRILEAPDLLPPPPALGGILMEPVEATAMERRPGFELPLQAAPMSRRLGAGAIDSLLVMSAFSLFAYIFFRVTSVVPPLQQAMGIAVALLAAFWIAYQYLLLVYAGTTPGLKLAKLRLTRFDGSTVPRKVRRWRVLASALSGMSLALGYAWCFLDEDRLCWHDRITHTYMAPQSTLEKSKSP